MKLLQLSLLFLMLITTILAFGFPQFRTYILQTISLLAIFSIIIHHLETRQLEKDRIRSAKQEQMVLFLSTELRPKLQEIEALLGKKKLPEAEDMLNELQGSVDSIQKTVG